MAEHRLQAITVSRRLVTMDSRGHLRPAILPKDTLRQGIHRLAAITADNHHLGTTVADQGDHRQEKASNERCHRRRTTGGHPHLALTHMLELMHEVILMLPQAPQQVLAQRHQAAHTLVLVVRLLHRLTTTVTAVVVVVGHHHRVAVHHRQAVTAEETKEMVVSDGEVPRTHTTGRLRTPTDKVAMTVMRIGETGHHPVADLPVWRRLVALTHTTVHQRRLPVAPGILHHLLGPMHTERRQRKWILMAARCRRTGTGHTEIQGQRMQALSLVVGWNCIKSCRGGLAFKSLN
mmetsp:Transcript_64376/g.112370  ORF Transcript_64376/g.112370 Transcript_64376/m.112370 type:complete len:291 (+) Transcript_64376:757-1629(+)